MDVRSLGLAAQANAGATTAPPTDAGSDTGFENVLARGISSTFQSLREAEGASISAMTGDGSLRVAIDSIVKADQELQTMIAVRDRVVSALQETTRMSI